MTFRTWDPFPVLRLPSPANKIHPENIRIRKKDWRFPTLHKTWFSVDSHLAASDPQGGSKVGPWSVLFSSLHPLRKYFFHRSLYISLLVPPFFGGIYSPYFCVCTYTERLKATLRKFVISKPNLLNYAIDAAAIHTHTVDKFTAEWVCRNV